MLSGAECRVLLFFNTDVTLQVFIIVEGTQAGQATQCNKTDALDKVSISALANTQEISTQTWASAKLS